MSKLTEAIKQSPFKLEDFDQEWTMFAYEKEGKFRHIYIDRFITKMCLYTEENLVEVTVKIAQDQTPNEDTKADQYWGWLGKRDPHPSMIQGCWLMFHMQFAYGVVPAIDKGDGIPVVLEIFHKTAILS